VLTPLIGGSSSPQNNNNSLMAGGGGVGKGKKKTGGAKLWMRFDRSGRSELVECDKSAIVRRAAIPARDLRILGPVFSHSSSILGKNFTNLIYLSFYLFVYY
jgi:magnesium transporter